MSTSTGTHLGYIDDLSDHQRELLYQLWSLFLDFGESSDDGTRSADLSSKRKKGGSSTSIFKRGTKRKNSKKENVGSVTSVTSSTSDPKAATSNTITSASESPLTSETTLDVQRCAEYADEMKNRLLDKGGTSSCSPFVLTSEFWAMLCGTDPDIMMLRFLRARKWDVSKAFAMLIDMLKWRVEFNVAKIMRLGERGIKQSILESGKSYAHGVDKQGRLVM